jgi:hypothetical protein
MGSQRLDSSLAARKPLAQELGYTGALDGSAEMNIWLHKQVMAKLCRRRRHHGTGQPEDRLSDRETPSSPLMLDPRVEAIRPTADSATYAPAARPPRAHATSTLTCDAHVSMFFT